MREAYAGLCSRWICEGAAAENRAAHHRLFEVLFAMPVFGAAAAAFAVFAGLSAANAFAVSVLLFAGVLIAAAVLSHSRDAAPMLVLLVFAFACAAAFMMPVAGFASLLPLAILAGGETFYILRSRRAAFAAAAGALVVSLAGVPIFGLGVALPLITAAAALFSLAHIATLILRRFTAPSPATASAPVSVASHILGLEGIVGGKLAWTGEVSDVEGSCIETLGVSPEALTGYGLFERILVGDRVAYLSALDEIRTGTVHAALEIRLRDASSSQGFRKVRAALSRVSPEVIALCLTAAPEIKPEQVSGPLAAADERQIHADRYLASVSHELRTPLNAILGFSDILQQEMFGALANERQREYVGLIHQSGAHLLSVVNMILDMSKIDMGAYQILSEPFEVKEAISLSLSMVRQQAAAKNIGLKTQLSDESVECVGDRRAFQQILINLLSNAVKFTPPGGSVCLETSQEDGYLKVCVNDTGIGISDADLDRIGQPFFQVQNDNTRSFEGTGLGLSLVRGLVELHCGGLTIESELGAGTSVIVRLPLLGPNRALQRPINLSERRPAAIAVSAELAGNAAKGARSDPAIRKTA